MTYIGTSLHLVAAKVWEIQVDFGAVICKVTMEVGSTGHQPGNTFKYTPCPQGTAEPGRGGRCWGGRDGGVLPGRAWGI